MNATPDPSDTSTPTIDPIAEPPAAVPVGHAGARVDISETRAVAANGFPVLLGGIALLAASVYALILGVKEPDAPRVGFIVASVVGYLLTALFVSTLVVISPGHARVVQFFGRYTGTERRTGLVWLPPLHWGRKISVRVNNFETHTLKVNDADGNPVEIAAIVVWQVADTAKAVFAVEDYKDFVAVQSEAALRHVATTHPYDDPSGEGTSLRGSTDQVSQELALEVAARVTVAGIEIVEVRISHLAYAPEIAQAMLQRQQAGAIVAARSRIVDGAVGMVELALNRLERDSIVELDDERKAAMVSNLLVVLCGESKATPIVNTGTLYA